MTRSSTRTGRIRATYQPISLSDEADWSVLESALGMSMNGTMRADVKAAMDRFMEEELLNVDAQRQATLRSNDRNALKLAELTRDVRRALKTWEALRQNESAALVLSEFDEMLKIMSKRPSIADAMSTLQRTLPYLRYMTDPNYARSALDKNRQDEASELDDYSRQPRKNRRTMLKPRDIKKSRSGQREAIEWFAGLSDAQPPRSDASEADLILTLEDIVISNGGRAAPGAGYRSSSKGHKLDNPRPTSFVKFLCEVASIVNRRLPEGTRIERQEAAWTSAIKNARRARRKVTDVRPLK
jgi:hypothetical protein